MRYQFFEIKNFKGIHHVQLDLARTPQNRIFTLVGLNESGKTTVLQAINLLMYRESLDSLRLPGYVQEDIHNLIPIAQRSNFTDKISIRTRVVLDDSDEVRIAEGLKTKGIRLTDPIRQFDIIQSYTFVNSRLQSVQPRSAWYIRLLGKIGSQRSPKMIPSDSEQWKIAIQYIKGLLPRILYFPNFLFDFPDRIYLESAPTEEDKHAFYRTVLQDVLDAIGEGTNIQDHILARAKSGEPFDKKSLESVLLKMSNHITSTVFSNWDKIFRRSPGRKEIVVSIDNDTPTGPWFLKLGLKEGDELYEVSERSLGFRWFFTFLLLTQYRGFRKSDTNDVLFLLDEPASNLHPSAQAQLLNSFANLPQQCSIIYTTHSHHMINPEWLEGAFVVRNEAMTYSEGEEQTFTARKTIISLEHYRAFAAAHPHQSTYFQPILDVLEYQPAKLENIPDVVMLEGKNDFYTLNFMRGCLERDVSLNFLPGGGSGSLDPVIRLYLAWGRNFVVLLDSDKAGKVQKSRYKKSFGLVLENRVFTLNDIDSTWYGKRMEDLFSEDERLSVQRACFPESEGFNKIQFNRAVQELALTKRTVSLSSETIENFNKFFNWCDTTINTLRIRS